MKRVHYTHPYLISPQHPVTVNVIGAGGTGSQVVTCLGRIHSALRSFDHPGLHLRVYDPDIITQANCGRQLFPMNEIGLNKAQCLITRMNMFFGTGWCAEPKLFPDKSRIQEKHMANIFITCTDNILSRTDLWESLMDIDNNSRVDFQTPIYWLDFGNARYTGQAVLGSIGEIKQPQSNKYQTIAHLPVVTELFDFKDVNEDDSGPSCSLAQALSKQDLMINSLLAQAGCSLLWKLFREGLIFCHGLYLNLSSMNINPINI